MAGNCQFNNDCDACPGRLVCRCLQVTEEAIINALTTLEPKTVQSLRQCTGAGTGCNACHKTLRAYIERHSLSLAG